MAYEVFASSAVAAPVVQYRRPVFEHPESAAVTFPISLAIKDLDLVLALGSEVGAPLPQTETNLAAMQAAAAAGLGAADIGSMAVDPPGLRGGSDPRMRWLMDESIAIADVTLKDIAECVGVNASTVSRALGPAKAHLVNAATIARVREAAKDLGYRGDHVAGSLRRRATATVGVIVGDLANPFIAPVIHGIAKALAAEQMLPLVFETQDDADQLTWGVNHLLSRRVDAIIVAGARFGDRHILEAATRFTPVVVAVRGLPGSPLPHVLHDDRAGGAMAARHLIDLGHTRLAELRGPMDIGNFVARHEGFRDACSDANVELVDGLGFGSRPIREEGKTLPTTCSTGTSAPCRRRSSPTTT